MFAAQEKRSTGSHLGLQEGEAARPEEFTVSDSLYNQFSDRFSTEIYRLSWFEALKTAFLAHFHMP